MGNGCQVMSIPTFKGRIRIGASIFHDHASVYWPKCKPPKSEYWGEEYQYLTKNPNMTFDVQQDPFSMCWICRRPGYGGEPYGNGPIVVFDPKMVALIGPPGKIS